jgi:hypothetical protein
MKMARTSTGDGYLVYMFNKDRLSGCNRLRMCRRRSLVLNETKGTSIMQNDFQRDLLKYVSSYYRRHAATS